MGKWWDTEGWALIPVDLKSSCQLEPCEGQKKIGTERRAEKRDDNDRALKRCPKAALVSRSGEPKLDIPAEEALSRCPNSSLHWGWAPCVLRVARRD